MQLFAVFREGVYRQECGGIFSSFDAAVSATTELITNEPDDYHSYVVMPFELDATTKRDDHRLVDLYGSLKEPKELMIITRKNGEVTETRPPWA